MPFASYLCSTHRLSGEVSIQMVTALVLQLIQCSVKIPDKADEMSEAAGSEDGGNENKSQVSFNKMCSSVFVLDK